MSPGCLALPAVTVAAPVESSQQLGTVTVGIFAYTVPVLRGPEPMPFLMIMFEAVSSFNTVGLSLGATDELEPISRLLTTVLMFVGRGRTWSGCQEGDGGESSDEAALGYDGADGWMNNPGR